MERVIRVLERLKGPVVPVNTCFDDDDSLDVGAMRKYINWLCEQNVPVILLTYGSVRFTFIQTQAQLSFLLVRCKGTLLYLFPARGILYKTSFGW